MQVCSKEKRFISLSQTHPGKKIRPIILQWEFNKFEIPGGGPPTPIPTYLHPYMPIKVYDVKIDLCCDPMGVFYG